MIEPILPYLLLGLWTLACVLFGACLQYRKQRGDHPATAVQQATKQLADVIRSFRETPDADDESKGARKGRKPLDY